MSCQEQHRDQVLLYLAGVLDEGQQRALEEHLDTSCPTCAAYVAEAEAALANVTLALPPNEPPSGARERLMARVQQDKQDAARAAEAASAPEPEDQVIVPKRKRSLLPRLLPMLAMGSVAACITTVAFLVPLNAHRARIAELEQQLSVAGQTVSKHESSLAQMSQAVDGATRLFDSLYASAAQLIPFTSDNKSYTDTVARMLWDKERNVCHFFVRRLQPADEGKSYHIWLMTNDQKLVRAGRFTPDEDGDTHVQFELPDGVESFTRAGVSYVESGEQDIADLTSALVLEGSLNGEQKP